MARRHKIRETPHDTKSRTYQLTAFYLRVGYPADTIAQYVGMSVEYVRGVEEYEARYRV